MTSRQDSGCKPFRAALTYDTYDTLSPFFYFHALLAGAPEADLRSIHHRHHQYGLGLCLSFYLLSVRLGLTGPCQIGSCVCVFYIYCPLVSLPHVLSIRLLPIATTLLQILQQQLTLTLSQSPASCSQFVSCHVLCRKSWLWPGVEPGSPRESVPVS